MKAGRVTEAVASLVAMSTPLPGAPDVTLATDSPVFSPAQVADLRARLDEMDELRGDWSLTTRTARAGTRRR